MCVGIAGRQREEGKERHFEQENKKINADSELTSPPPFYAQSIQQPVHYCVSAESLVAIPFFLLLIFLLPDPVSQHRYEQFFQNHSFKSTLLNPILLISYKYRYGRRGIFASSLGLLLEYRL